MESKSQFRRMVSQQDHRISVVCMECGKKWKTASVSPQCSRCNSVDIEVADY